MVIVTMTLARDAEEAATLERALGELVKTRLPVYVGEGGSEPSFVRRLRQLPNLHLCAREPGTKPGLVGQLRSAFAAAQAAQPGYVLYTEPDKLSFFRRGLPRLIAAAPVGGEEEPGLVVAGRSPRAFATFPEGQRTAEALMNRICGEALGQQGDYTYGPMLLHASLLPYFALVPADLGWGWRFFILAVARQLRMQIAVCPIGSQCPRSQRGEDDSAARAYRLRQLVQNVTGLANGWKCLLDQGVEGAAA